MPLTGSLTEHPQTQGSPSANRGSPAWTFADDVALVSNNADDLSNALQSFQSEAINLGLNISWQKTKVQVLNHSGNGTPSHFMVNRQSVDVVEDFTSEVNAPAPDDANPMSSDGLD